MIALIDGDIVVYTAAAKAEHAADFGDGIIHNFVDSAEVEREIDEMIADLKEQVGATRVVVALSCRESNFRKEVYPEYKSNRKGKKPLGFAHGREYVTKQYQAWERPSLEADDILGILATGDIRGMCGPKVVVSIDKDMRTFPCSLFNWMKPKDGIVTIGEMEADVSFFKQVLTGDSTDGYPGCPGLGPVRAERLLLKVYHDHGHDHLRYWEAIVDAYEKAGLVEYDAITQARCARILRACDYNFEEKLPILWTPPQGGAPSDGAKS